MKRLIVLVTLVVAVFAVSVVSADSSQIQNQSQFQKMRALNKKATKAARKAIRAGLILPKTSDGVETLAAGDTCDSFSYECGGYFGSFDEWSYVANCLAHFDVYYDSCSGTLLHIISWPGCNCGDGCMIIDEVVCYQ